MLAEYSLEAASGQGSYRFVASDDQEQFLSLGQRFFGDTIESVEIRCDERNVASARVPERLGYRAEGLVEPGKDSIEGYDGDVRIWRLSRDK